MLCLDFGLEMKELKWKECEILFVKRKKIRWMLFGVSKCERKESGNYY